MCPSGDNFLFINHLGELRRRGFEPLTFGSVDPMLYPIELAALLVNPAR